MLPRPKAGLRWRRVLWNDISGRSSMTGLKLNAREAGNCWLLAHVSLGVPLKRRVEDVFEPHFHAAAGDVGLQAFTLFLKHVGAEFSFLIGSRELSSSVFSDPR